MVKKYVDFPVKDIEEIKWLVDNGYFVTEAEVIRKAVSYGLPMIKKEKGISQ